MAKRRPLSKFYGAMIAAPKIGIRGPVNSAAIQRDANLVLGKIASLHAYHEYLTQARSWKARAKALPFGFEHEVQAQAAAALTDTRALASAALRMTSQFKHSGELDRMLSSSIAAIRQSGPVQSADLIADLENEPSIRQIVQAEGVTDEVWSSLITNLKSVNARLFVQRGKLAAELKILSQDKPRNVALTLPASGMPKTLTDLLQRGSFERLTELFLRNDRSKLQLLPGPQRDLEMADVVLSGSILSVQSMADHSRGLQDVGLAKYAGRATAIIWVVAFLASAVIGYLLVNKYCKKGESENAACIAGQILSVLGILGLMALLVLGLAILFPATGSTGPTMQCPGGVYYNTATQEATCVMNVRPN